MSETKPLDSPVYDRSMVEVATSLGPMRLKPDELKMLRALENGTCDWQRAQGLYASVSGRTGRYPLEWERLTLKVTIEALPDRKDLVDRLAKVEQELSGPQAEELLKLDPEAVMALLHSGQISQDTLMRFVGELVREGRPVPLEAEIATLEFYITQDSSRLDLKRRLVAVLKRAGRPVAPELAGEVSASYIEEEHATDFQAMMAEYGARVGFSDLEPEFSEDLAAVRRYTMTSVERLYSLWDACRYVHEAKVPGAIVECGVWRGGSMMTAALAFRRLGETSRDLWLYDTFSGLPRPDPEIDVDVLGNRMIDGWEPREVEGGRALWAYADEADVRSNMAQAGYPQERTRFVAGLVEETIPGDAPKQIALLRIDTDWHSSYVHILEHLYDRVAPGGILLFDDYGQLLGARRAVDDFRRSRGLHSPMIRIDFSCRMMLKI